MEGGYQKRIAFTSGNIRVLYLFAAAPAKADAKVEPVEQTMPTILRIRGYRFYFYSHEPNEPPHIHVDKDSCSLKAWLEQVSLARNIGFRPREINDILKLIEENRTAFLEAWHEYFS